MGSALQNEKFRIHVKPLQDELLSSWLIRTAYAHHTDTATFINLHFPAWKNQLWTRDVDVSLSDEFLEILSYKSGLSCQELYSLTIKSYEGYLAEKISTGTRNNLVQPLGNYSRIKIKYGLRYCPICLKEDETPYFRKKWRLSFSTACLVHKSFLIDRCLACGTSITAYKRYYEDHFPDCYKCGADLRQFTPQKIQEGSYGLWAITKLYEVLDNGVFRYGDRYAYSFLFFDVLRHLVRIVYLWGKDIGLLDREVMSSDIEFRKQKLKKNLIEEIPLKEQYLLFSGLVRLFEGFPGRLYSFAGGNSLRGTDLSRDLRYIPFWYSNVLDAFSMSVNPISIDEVKSVIYYLKKKVSTINKASVGKVLGVSPDFKKRKDIQELIANANPAVIPHNNTKQIPR